MNLESWQAGLVLGAAFSLVVEHAVRVVLWRLRIRKRKQCPHCTGILGDDGRAEFPVECLKVCAVCGDTWPASDVERTEQAHREGRGTELPALRAVAVEVCSCRRDADQACSECE